MGCDMVVAMGSATVGEQTFLGLNSHAPYGTCAMLERAPGRPHEPGETVQTTYIELPQARLTHTVLGCRSQRSWGYQSGINEHQLAIGCASWRSKLEADHAGLTRPDLVRLGLERCRTAQQAVDLITDLIARHGQGRFSGGDGEDSDAILLIADPSESFLIEAAGPYWAYLECHEVRAVSDTAMIHQDWNRVSHGLAEHAIDNAWWRDDGNKIDFARSVRGASALDVGALRRWGRATRHLQQQNGHIDLGFIRRVLSDHYEETSAEVQPLLARPSAQVPLCRHARIPGQVGTSFSFIANLSSESSLATAWIAFGPPCASLYFPLFAASELPDVFTCVSGRDSISRRTQQLLVEVAAEPEELLGVQQSLAHLQERFDQQLQEFLEEAAREGDRLSRLAGLLMQNQVEQYADELQHLRPAVGHGALRDY